MKHIKVKGIFKEDWKNNDCRRIVEVFENKGFLCSMDQAYQMWSLYSEDFCANWLGMVGFSDAELFLTLEDYFEVDDDNGKEPIA